MERWGSTAVNIRKARSFNEIHFGAHTPITRAELGDMIAKSLASHGLAKSATIAGGRLEPLPVTQITVPRSSSSYMVEITTKVQAMRKDGETLTAVWDRASRLPEIAKLYDAYNAARAREAGNIVEKSAAMAREAVRDAAKAEKANVEREVQRQAEELRRKYPDLTPQQARSRVLSADPALYSTWLQADMSEKNPRMGSI